MTQQEKQLLLKDLSARLSYGIRVSVSGDEFDKYQYPYLLTAISKFEQDSFCKVYSPVYTPLGCPSIENVKPYLRPMSSMTEEEKREVGKLGVCYDGAFHNDIYDIGISMEEAFTAISWLLERHFDINYLIEKGLVLEASEGMYKNE